MFLITLMVLISILSALFFFSAKKYNEDELQSSIFECGFTSYFFSRYSFSIHYFLIGLIFLFLDLELCFIFPLFTCEPASTILKSSMIIFVGILIAGLLWEWKEEKIEWIQ